MAKVGAQRAATLTGKSKSTIQRAMNSGKLSYEIDQNDRRLIDVSELERVFGIKPQGLKAQETSAPQTPEAQDVTTLVEIERMKMQVKMLEQQLSTANEHIDDLKEQRDKWEKQASQVLITSQYSQKQADELRAQIKEREERARQRRLQNAKMQHAQSNSQRAAKTGDGQTSKPEHLSERMKLLKAQNENTSTAEEAQSTVFRFWKRAKS